MCEGENLVIFSPEILTEKGVFEVGSQGTHVITKVGEYLLVTDPISLSVVDQLGAYPEAKNVTVSPSADYVCFLDGNPPSSLIVIELETKEIEKVKTNSLFSIDHLFWSPDSKFIVFSSELSVYLAIYSIREKKTAILEGADNDDFKLPIAQFSPNVQYFSMIKNSVLVSYASETWKSHSVIKCTFNPSGILYVDQCAIAVWNNSGEFVIYSLLGDKLFSRNPYLASIIKAAKLCQEKRILVLATFDDKVEIYDVLLWNKLFSFEYPLKISQNSLIWTESITNLAIDGEKNFFHLMFRQIPQLIAKPVKNICDEFKLKTTKSFFLEFSYDNTFLATYSPSFSHKVWIWSYKTGNLFAVISMNDNSLQDLQWHPNEKILAAITLDSVIFWKESKTFAVYSKNCITSFNWLQTKLVMCSVATLNHGVLMYIEKC